MTDREGIAPDALYTTAQVAQRLQLPVPTIRGAIRRGKLHAFLPAGRRHGYRIAESAIQEFLRASATPRTQERPDAA